MSPLIDRACHRPLHYSSFLLIYSLSLPYLLILYLYPHSLRILSSNAVFQQCRNGLETSHFDGGRVEMAGKPNGDKAVSAAKVDQPIDVYLMFAN